MIEFIRENPVTLGRFRAQEQMRAQDQNARQEEQGFRDRYAHETAVNTDRAIRNALSGVTAQGAAPQAQQASAPQGPRVGPQLSGSLPGGGATPAQASAPAPATGNNAGGAGVNDRVVQALSQVEGGGALALKRFSENQANHDKRQDALEDKAWNIFANSKRPADLDMANAVFKQATGKDFPPQWRNQQAAMKAATIDAAARERYPRDIVKRREFIKVSMTQGFEKALQSMVGEGAAPKHLGTVNSEQGVVQITQGSDGGFQTGILKADGQPLTPFQRNRADNKTTKIKSDEQNLKIAKDLHTDENGKVNLQGMQATLTALEQGVPLSEVVNRIATQNGGTAQIDDLTALDLANAVTNALAHPLKLDSFDSGFDVTGGDRELFKNQVEAAIKSGNQQAAYRMIGNDTDAKKVLDAHFGGQDQRGSTQRNLAHEGGVEPLPAGGAKALVVGKAYQTKRGPRTYLGFEEGVGHRWEVPPGGAPEADAESELQKGLGIGG